MGKVNRSGTTTPVAYNTSGIPFSFAPASSRSQAGGNELRERYGQFEVAR